MATLNETGMDGTTQRFRLGALIRDFETLTSDIQGEKGFVFLEDVQFAFDTEAARFQAGTVVIPFMRGPDHRKYLPERIPCRPGVIIDIIEDPTITATNQEPLVLPDPAAVADIDPTSVSEAVQALAIEDTDPTSAVPMLESLPAVERVVDQPQAPQSQVAVSTAISATTTTTTTVTVAEETTSSSPIDVDRLPSADNPKFKQFVHVRLEELVDKSEQMIRMQQEALDRLALIQTKAEAILVQNFELLEYTIPRLFIVLPETPSSKWSPSNLLGTKFRLYFICECGEHTRQPGSKIPHYLHLAKHEGYTITQPNKFFVDYGPYLLVMLTLLKHGISIAGIMVPALSTLRVVDVVDSVKESCETVTRQVIDGVDQSISFLEEFRVKELQNKESSLDLQKSSQNEIAEYLLGVKGLEGADLRQLASYLSVGDSDNLLGNLYRITTKHGHVKWVCKDHYREGYQAANNIKLCDVVKASRGVVDEQVGKVVVTIKSAIAAAQLYDALLKSQGIYELELTMAWNQENSDLTKLKDAIKKSAVTTLTLDLQLKRGPFGINLSGKRRNDPILSMLKHPALKSVHLRGVPADFFHRSGISPKDDYPNLTTFEMDEWASLQKDAARICTLAARSPNLERIRLNVYNDEVLTTVAELLDSRWEDSVPLKVQFGSTESSLGVWFEMLIPKGDRVEIDWNDFPEFLKKWGHHITNLGLCNEITEEIALALALATTRTDTKQSSLKILDIERSIAVPPEQKTVLRSQALRKVVAQSPLQELTVDLAFAPDAQIVSEIQWQHLRRLRFSSSMEAKTLPLSSLLRSMQAAGKSAILVEDFTVTVRGRGFEDPHFAQLQGVISLLPKLELLVVANTLYPAQWLKLLSLLDFNRLEYLEVHVPAFRLKDVEQFMAAIPLQTTLKTLVMEGATFGHELAITDPVQVTVMKARGIRVVNSREKLDKDHPYYTRYKGK